MLPSVCGWSHSGGMLGEASQTVSPATSFGSPHYAPERKSVIGEKQVFSFSLLKPELFLGSQKQKEGGRKEKAEKRLPVWLLKVKEEKNVLINVTNLSE